MLHYDQPPARFTIRLPSHDRKLNYTGCGYAPTTTILMVSRTPTATTYWFGVRLPNGGSTSATSRRLRLSSSQSRKPSPYQASALLNGSQHPSIRFGSAMRLIHAVPNVVD